MRDAGAERAVVFESRADVARLVDHWLERLENIQRLASVTDPLTLARYMVELHMDLRPMFDAAADVLAEDDDSPN